MRLDFTNLFNSSAETVNIDSVLPFDEFEYGAYRPLKDGVNVKGRAYTKADVVYLDINIAFVFSGICDRCADEFKRNFSFDIERIVVTRLENEEDDEDYILLDADCKFDLDEFVYQEIQLYLPQKMLCSDDCKGLCPKCGKNLNKEKCNCEKDVDPRMAALLQLLDEDN